MHPQIQTNRMAKKKHQGHYCKVCGEYKSNESFTGKGHKNHICKKCAMLPEEVRKKMIQGDFEEDADFFEDIELPFDEGNGEYQSPDAVYYDGYLSFVGLDRLSAPEYEAKRYNKLKDTEKTFLRGEVQNLIIDFWKYNIQIPDGGEVNKIMNTSIKHIEEKMSFTVKNDKDLRRIVQSMVVPTINKQLRRENKKKEEG